MNKKIITFVILSSLILGALGSAVYERVIIPRLASIPFLVRHNIAPAPGPLVINTTQEVRVDDGSDIIAAIQRVTPWTVEVLEKNSSGVVQNVGGGILLTSDGLIATTKNVIGGQTQLWVTTNDGTTEAATIVAADPASDLVLIQAALKNQPSAAFTDLSTLQLGMRVVLLSQSSGQSQDESHVTYISSLPQNIPINTVLFSDQISKTIGVNSAVNPITTLPNQSSEGSVVADSEGTVLGLYSHSGIITNDTIQSALNSYFNNKQIVRPAIGMYYEYISPEISAITGLHQGVVVTRPNPKTPAIVAGSAAQQSGIQEGDNIYQVNGTQIDTTHTFESLISSQQPNSVLTLDLIRGTSHLVITLIVKQK